MQEVTAEMIEFMQQLRDKEEIRERLLQYCRGVDRFDEDLIRSAFHPDATDNHGTYIGDVEGLIDWVRSRLPSTEQQVHILGNCLIDLFGDRAAVETYALAFHRYAPGAATYLGESTHDGRLRLTTVFRYVDRFERRNGEWRIADRTLVMEDSWPMPVDNAALPDPETWILARRDKDDPMWGAREWAAGGGSA